MRESAASTSLDAGDVDRIVAVLEAAPVTVGVLYGSRARAADHERSDVDIAIGFEAGLSSTERTQARLALTADLAVSLGTDDVDLAVLSGATPELVAEIRRDGVLIYGSRDDFERSVTDGEPGPDREDVLGDFDDVLDDVERVV